MSAKCTCDSVAMLLRGSCDRPGPHHDEQCQLYAFRWEMLKLGAVELMFSAGDVLAGMPASGERKATEAEIITQRGAVALTEFAVALVSSGNDAVQDIIEREARRHGVPWIRRELKSIEADLNRRLAGVRALLEALP